MIFYLNFSNLKQQNDGKRDLVPEMKIILNKTTNLIPLGIL